MPTHPQLLTISRVALPNITTMDRLVESCNNVLERELSAYRLINRRFVQITDEVEIQTLDQALQIPIQQVKDHLATSLSLLADRKNPDYRNSIKESISAVEATAKIITRDKKATLGQALKKLGLHPTLESGLSKIYGYASEADGIRHALTDEPNVSHDDAKLMLVSCSAFVNYLIAKATKAGIQLA